MKATRRLRELLKRPGVTIVPGAFECIGMRIIQSEGFEAAYVTGGGISASRIGKPDVGLTTMSEIVGTVRNMAQTVDIPLIVDADTGYGNPLNVMRTVRELEQAGAAAVQIEDQIFPKRCGHFDGKQVIPEEDMVQKVRAACEARSDPDLVVVARTDAIAVTGFDDALQRAHAYAEAGADLLFIEAPRTVEQIRQIGADFETPLLFNLAASGKTPSIEASEMGALGFKLACFAGIGIWAVAQTLQKQYRLLKETGDIESFRDMMMPFNDFWDLMGMAEVKELEAKYAVAEAVVA